MEFVFIASQRGNIVGNTRRGAEESFFFTHNMGFEKEVLKEGTGETVPKGRSVTVHCTGK